MLPASHGIGTISGGIQHDPTAPWWTVHEQHTSEHTFRPDSDDVGSVVRRLQTPQIISPNVHIVHGTANGDDTSSSRGTFFFTSPPSRNTIASRHSRIVAEASQQVALTTPPIHDSTDTHVDAAFSRDSLAPTTPSATSTANPSLDDSDRDNGDLLHPQAALAITPGRLVLALGRSRHITTATASAASAATSQGPLGALASSNMSNGGRTVRFTIDSDSNFIDAHGTLSGTALHGTVAKSTPADAIFAAASAHMTKSGIRVRLSDTPRHGTNEFLHRSSEQRGLTPGTASKSYYTTLFGVSDHGEAATSTQELETVLRHREELLSRLIREASPPPRQRRITSATSRMSAARLALTDTVASSPVENSTFAGNRDKSAGSPGKLQLSEAAQNSLLSVSEAVHLLAQAQQPRHISRQFRLAGSSSLASPNPTYSRRDMKTTTADQQKRIDGPQVHHRIEPQLFESRPSLEPLRTLADLASPPPPSPPSFHSDDVPARLVDIKAGRGTVDFVTGMPPTPLMVSKRDEHDDGSHAAESKSDVSHQDTSQDRVAIDDSASSAQSSSEGVVAEAVPQLTLLPAARLPCVDASPSNGDIKAREIETQSGSPLTAVGSTTVVEAAVLTTNQRTEAHDDTSPALATATCDSVRLFETTAAPTVATTGPLKHVALGSTVGLSHGAMLRPLLQGSLSVGTASDMAAAQQPAAVAEALGIVTSSEPLDVDAAMTAVVSSMSTAEAARRSASAARAALAAAREALASALLQRVTDAHIKSFPTVATAVQDVVPPAVPPNSDHVDDMPPCRADAAVTATDTSHRRTLNVPQQSLLNARRVRALGIDPRRLIPPGKRLQNDRKLEENNSLVVDGECGCTQNVMAATAEPSTTFSFLAPGAAHGLRAASGRLSGAVDAAAVSATMLRSALRGLVAQHNNAAGDLAAALAEPR